METITTSEPPGRRGDQSGTSSPATKQCKRCGETKPTSEFYPRAAAPDKLQAYCMTCENAVRRTGGQVGFPRKSADVLPPVVLHFDQSPDATLLDAPPVVILSSLAPRSPASIVASGRLPPPRHDGHRRVWTVGQVRAVLAGEVA